MALTKTQGVLYAIASTASNAVSVGSALDVSTFYTVDVWIRMGRGTATAFTVAPRFRLEGAYVASPTANDWLTLAEFQSAVGATTASQAVSGTAAAGATSITLAAGTNFAADDYVFFHNTTLANSEWKRVVTVVTATLTVQDGLVNAQTGATARDQSEEYHALLDAVGLQQVRLVVNGAGSGQAVIAAANYGAVSAL